MISDAVAAILVDMRAKADGARCWSHRSTLDDFNENYYRLQQIGVVERGGDGALVISRLGRDELLRWEHYFARSTATTRRPGRERIISTHRRKGRGSGAL